MRGQTRLFERARRGFPDASQVLFYLRYELQMTISIFEFHFPLWVLKTPGVKLEELAHARTPDEDKIVFLFTHDLNAKEFKYSSGRWKRFRLFKIYDHLAFIGLVSLLEKADYVGGFLNPPPVPDDYEITASGFSLAVARDFFERQML